MARLNIQKRRTLGNSLRVKSEINVTPLVDVMLVLLVIFMVTAPLITAGVNVELPQAKADAISNQPEDLIITVTKNRQIYIGDNLLNSTSDLINFLNTKISERASSTSIDSPKNKKASSPTPTPAELRILLKGDRNVDYGFVLQIFSELRGAGYYSIGLLTESIEPIKKQSKTTK